MGATLLRYSWQIRPEIFFLSSPHSFLPFWHTWHLFFYKDFKAWFNLTTLPETNSSHLKMDGWITIVSFWGNLGRFSPVSTRCQFWGFSMADRWSLGPRDPTKVILTLWGLAILIGEEVAINPTDGGERVKDI